MASLSCSLDGRVSPRGLGGGGWIDWGEESLPVPILGHFWLRDWALLADFWGGWIGSDQELRCNLPRVRRGAVVAVREALWKFEVGVVVEAA